MYYYFMKLDTFREYNYFIMHVQVVVLASLAPLRPLNALYEPLQTCHGDSVSSGRWVGVQHLPLTQKHSSVALPSVR